MIGTISWRFALLGCPSGDVASAGGDVDLARGYSAAPGRCGSLERSRSVARGNDDMTGEEGGEGGPSAVDKRPGNAHALAASATRRGAPARIADKTEF